MRPARPREPAAPRRTPPAASTSLSSVLLGDGLRHGLRTRSAEPVGLQHSAGAEASEGAGADIPNALAAQRGNSPAAVDMHELEHVLRGRLARSGGPHLRA